MTTTTANPVRATSRQRSLAAVGLAASLLGAASAGLLIGWDPQVPSDQFSYPFEPGGFAVVQTFFFVQHLPLAVLLGLLWTSGVTGRGQLAKVGVIGSVASMLGLAVTELIAIASAEATYPSSDTAHLDVLYGATSIGIGLFTVLAGIATIPARVWTGWERWLPLAIGVYVFVVLTPGIMLGFDAGRLVIGAWMLLFAALGWALMRRA
ncbi:hypothetical protein [Nocardioides speluncae]|uniref:hypothetical protein n=1 Tax=Nocardioides speluncae TaxID=2670337 RepID=UPI000D68AFED|nr:hypothetical protein [Nocardioides speluncae]